MILHLPFPNSFSGLPGLPRAPRAVTRISPWRRASCALMSHTRRPPVWRMWELPLQGPGIESICHLWKRNIIFKFVPWDMFSSPEGIITIHWFGADFYSIEGYWMIHWMLNFNPYFAHASWFTHSWTHGCLPPNCLSARPWSTPWSWLQGPNAPGCNFENWKNSRVHSLME